jgi:hypothetical protein
VSSTSYQLELGTLDRNADHLTDSSVTETAAATTTTTTMPAPPVAASASLAQELDLKVPVSEIDSSLLVFASKSKPKVSKPNVSFLFSLCTCVIFILGYESTNQLKKCNNMLNY